MIYVFDDGRIIYDADLILPEHEGHYICVSELTTVPEIEGKNGSFVANMQTGQIEVVYYDALIEETQPEILSDQEAMLYDIQANTEYLVCLSELSI